MIAAATPPTTASGTYLTGSTRSEQSRHSTHRATASATTSRPAPTGRAAAGLLAGRSGASTRQATVASTTVVARARETERAARRRGDVGGDESSDDHRHQADDHPEPGTGDPVGPLIGARRGAHPARQAEGDDDTRHAQRTTTAARQEMPWSRDHHPWCVVCTSTMLARAPDWWFPSALATSRWRERHAARHACGPSAGARAGPRRTRAGGARDAAARPPAVDR